MRPSPKGAPDRYEHRSLRSSLGPKRLRRRWLVQTGGLDPPRLAPSPYSSSAALALDGVSKQVQPINGCTLQISRTLLLITKNSGALMRIQSSCRLTARVLLATTPCLSVDALPGEGRIDASNGDVQFEVHFRFASTPKHVSRYMGCRRANCARVVCDAADRQMRVKRAIRSAVGK
jgi:hypothetical protein